ncbi:MAG: hypothetical protein ATN34_05435 [Epulopiscium sp. Nele67-Bin002]|nr:MAG: hypothetical protein ATN33_02185 [Epulopiscium sp. Nele67-Bin001]OON91786.1 MAG: hypothetical protein ATN34_05435 [Epulopiscium sp. Nele67-Bin002]
MKKFVIGMIIACGIVIGADTTISHALEPNSIANRMNGGFLWTTSNLTENDLKMGVNVSALPEGPQTYEDITKINISSACLPIVIEEADVEFVTVTDTTIVNNVPENTQNTINVSGGVLYFRDGVSNDKDFNNGIGFTQFISNGTHKMGLESGYVHIQVPYGTELDYSADILSGSVLLDVVSKNVEINGAGIDDITIKQGGNKLEINSVGADIEVGGAFNYVEVTGMGNDVYLVVDSDTKKVSLAGMGMSNYIEIEDSTVYNISIDGLGGSINDNYSGYKSNSAMQSVKYGNSGTNIEIAGMGISVTLDDWR